MKKVLLGFLLLFSTVCSAQNIKFLGIPLGISYSSFKQQLVAKGFKFNASESNNEVYNNFYLFNGRFAGEVAGLSVMVTSKSKIVYGVSVRFRNYAYCIDGRGVSEELQIQKYLDIRSSIIKKYPNVKPFDWSSSDFPKATSWDSSKWEIDLCISWYRDVWKNIDLVYYDKIAKQKAQQEMESDF